MEITYILAALSLLAFMVLATYDGFYLHLWKYRLYAREASRLEHLTHTARAILFPLIVIFMVLNETSFPLFVVGIVLAVLDFVILAIDAYSEKDSREFMGGLPKSEYIIHLFSNGFHYGFVILSVVIRLDWHENSLVFVPIAEKGLFAAQLFSFSAENAVPGAIILAILHVLLYLDKNSFKLFGMKRKLGILCPIEGFFKLHSGATEGEKDEKWAQKGNFLAI